MGERKVLPRGSGRIRTSDGDRSLVETDDGVVLARNAKHARYLRMARSGPEMLTADEWQGILRASNGRCCYCGRKVKRLTMDHVIPLSRGGTHTADNVSACCRECNNAKGDKTLEEWTPVMKNPG